MKNERKFLGEEGENFAAAFVAEAGLEVIARNYRCPKGEMDLIARDGETMVFVEVRTRRSSYRGWGEESITRPKVKRLQAIAAYFLLELGYKTWPSIRFDVLALRWSKENPDVIWLKAVF